MATFYKDDIFKMNQYTCDEQMDYFDMLLETRQNGMDSKRFFLKYISKDLLDKYDFSSKNSLNEFRKICLTYNSPLFLMGGCNLDTDCIQKGFRYSGIQMSDPDNTIKGIFFLWESKLIYSPLLAPFYEQRDLTKFANDTYFTSTTFKEIMLQQLKKNVEFYLHSGYYSDNKDILKHGKYILEKIKESEMLDFICDAAEGQKIYEKAMKNIRTIQ